MKPNVPARSFTQTSFNVQSDISMVGGRLLRNSTSSGSTGEGGGDLQTYTLSICVDGVPKLLDVYVDGEPY
jgi:hypothetical protein